MHTQFHHTLLDELNQKLPLQYIHSHQVELHLVLDGESVSPMVKQSHQRGYVMLLSILSKDRVVQKDKPVGVLPTKSTYTPEITKTMT